MSQNKKGIVDKFLSLVEKVGNLLPHPATLFALFALATIVLSYVFSLTDMSVVHPATKETVTPFNLLSSEGIQKIMKGMVTNFTGFAPLGTVLVSLLGIGIAEGSGLIAAVIRGIVQNSEKILYAIFATIGVVAFLFVEGIGAYAAVAIGTILALLIVYYINKTSPATILTFIIVFSGIISNTASEVGYVLLVPLGAIMFIGAGRHPIAGLAAAFAGVSGGYSANLLLGTIDPLLAGISTEAARILDPSYDVGVAANYFFMMASVFFIGVAGTFVTQKIVEPRLGEYEGEGKLSSDDKDKVKKLTSLEKNGIIYASIASVIFIGILLVGVLPEWGFFRELDPAINLDTEELFIRKIKPFLKSIVGLIFIGAGLLGVAYGIGAKTIKNDEDVMNGMSEAMKTLGSYIVLVFFAAQFVAYFKWTNLGIITAINGADFLQSSGLGTIPLLVAFIILAALINLVMGSASAKWAIMAPVFIPMFMLLGFSPELTQGAYRVGDSVTNIISPMMSYFALIIAFMQRYDKKAKIGTLVATMIPYSIVFFLIWTTMFIIWYSLGWPLGPDSPLFIDPATLGQ
jgi:aminobenzoyl-glutamate transport protein